MLPRVLIYRDMLLPRSETFIVNQAERLKRYRPYYAGTTKIDGLPLPEERTLLFHGRGLLGKLGNVAYRRSGVSPHVTRILMRVQPSLVHAHFGFDATHVLRLCRAFRLPLVVTLHDYDVTSSDADLLSLSPHYADYIRRRPQLNQRATKFLAVSQHIKEKAIARGFSREKIVVHYIGVDTEIFRPSPERGREPIVLFVGRLVPKKGVAYLVRAMAEVQRNHPKVELVVVGTGPLLEELRAQAANSLTAYRFVGALPPAEVRAWIARASIFCAPSVTAASGETEGLPITVLEALASGCPVVSTVHAGIPEAVTHGENGFLAPESDSELLARHLLELVTNRDLADRFGKSARSRVLERFDLRQQTAVLETLYDDAVAGSFWRSPWARSLQNSLSMVIGRKDVQR
ncbi:MAG TPA: glycosyltransferase [Polyangiaceae bacterium]